MKPTTTLPDDPQLPGLVAIRSIGLALAIPALGLGEESVELLLHGYTRGQRAALEARTAHRRVAIKAYASNPVLEVALYQALVDAGLAGGSGVRVPRLLAWDDKLCLEVISWLEGPTALELVGRGQGRRLQPVHLAHLESQAVDLAPDLELTNDPRLLQSPFQGVRRADGHDPVGRLDRVVVDQDGAAVLNISSAMGRLRERGYLAYGTAKAAMAHMTRLLAADLAPRIRVNALAVGSVLTSALEIVAGNEELRRELEEGTPLKRLGDPADIAAAALWLCSEAGSFVTGKVVEVDGGIEYPNLKLPLPDLEPGQV